MFRMIALVLAFAAALVLGEDVSEGIVLLQTSVNLQHSTLPEVVPLLDSSRTVLNLINKHVADLENHLNDTQTQETEMLQGLKDKLEANLTAQNDLNNLTDTQNSNLKVDIGALNNDIMSLRAKAASLKKHNGNLVTDFRALQENITTVSEFTLQAISKSEEMLELAPELAVLSDLAQKEDKASQERDHSNRLQAVAKAKQEAVSLFQTDMETDAQTDNIIKGRRTKGHSSLSKVDKETKSEVDKETKSDKNADMVTESQSYSSVLTQSTLQGMLIPEADRIASGFLEMVNSALTQLVIEHNESASQMMAQFNIDYGLGSDLYAEHLDEQAQLNTTKAASIELKHRLTDAVEHLEKVHKELFQRGQSLRAFSKRMASKPLPDAAPTPQSGSFVNELNDTQFSSFLQVGSSHGKILPNVSQVLTKPEEIFSALSSHVNKLGERLTAVERQGQEHMSALKQSLEANLTDQKDHIGNETAENTQLKADIDQLNGNIAHLRSTADDLKRKNKNLVEDLKSLHRNMSTIEEFAMNSLNTSEEQLTTAPQLQVLQELAQKEQEMEHQHAHSQSLSAVSAAKGAISLIQIDDDAHGLVEYLNNALQQLASEQNASEASMTASFQKDYSEGADQLAALAEEQQNLKTSKSDATELQAKLQAAVDHLETTHKHLTENSQAVRGFAQRMGLKPLPLEPEESASLIQLLSLFNCKSLLNNPFAHSPCSSLLKKSPAAESVSLLQLGSSTDEEVVKNADLPSVPEVMTGPKHMFDTMSAQVSNLEARLAEVQKKNQDEMIDMKHKYDGNLTGTKTENTNITSQNAALKTDINRINKSVRKLRSRANQLESDNGILLLDMQKMKANLTTAQEFTTKAMNSSDEMLFTAPELHVLTELAKKEDQMGSERAHSSRMGEVSAASGMSLLQVDSSESKNTKKSKRTKESKRTQPAKESEEDSKQESHEDSHGLLDMMTDALQELAVAQNNSAAILTGAFDKDLDKMMQKRATLLAEQVELQATKTSALQLEAKLSAAVEHLDHLHSHLLERAESIHAFAHRLSEKHHEDVN